MIDEILSRTRAATRQAPPLGAAPYADYCDALLDRLTQSWPSLVDANAEDRRAMRERGMSESLVDRIRFGDEQRQNLVRLAGQVKDWLRRDAATPPPEHRAGPLTVRRVPRPLGVVLMVYEARPTVTVEGALLPVVRGNAVILRGGREIAATNRALAPVVADSLRAAGLPAHMVCVLDDGDRRQLRALLARDDAVDVLVPRGGPSLIDLCRASSTIPIIASGGGANHLYVHRSSDLREVVEIVLDSKLPDPTACNSLETVLCDAEVAADLLRLLVRVATERKESFTVKIPPGLVGAGVAEPSAYGTESVQVRPFQDADRGREFLDRTVALLPVSGPDEAADHIRVHGSAHTEGIAAADPAVVESFCRQVDAAAVVVNGSLRLHDGPTLGLGPEISISTGRLHVRGPVDLAALTTHSWVVDAHGTLRSSPDTSWSD